MLDHSTTIPDERILAYFALFIKNKAILNTVKNSTFIKKIWDYSAQHRRDMSWRKNITPYRIVVSEIMLQQTQADRVAKKFDGFIRRFPSWKALALAPTKDVLEEWQGLGYNRRALNLQKCARAVVEQHKGKLPQTPEELIELPSIGPNTAGSILAFAFNIPHPFIETNIRSVYIHHFFSKKSTTTKISDKEILQKVTETLDQENPREWYYALMDYGTHLKKLHINPSRKSKHHKSQSKFKGSHRELRAHILKLLIKEPYSYTNLITTLQTWRKTLSIDESELAISELEQEGFIMLNKNLYTIV